jgi:hypothetical protein
VEVQKGYWNTIGISWHQFEIQVFESRLEIYDFKAAGGTDIWYEEHTYGKCFPLASWMSCRGLRVRKPTPPE